MRWRTIGLVGLLATAIGVAFAVQYRALMLASGHPVSIPAAFLMQAIPWYLWALFLPIIAAVPRRWPVCPGLVRIVSINVVLGLVLTGLHLALSHALLPRLPGAPWPQGLTFPPGLGPVSVAQVAGGMTIYGLLIGLVYMEHYRRAFADAEVRAAQLEAQVVTAELKSLRAQLCPHFLFNTLNSVCGLIPREPERAEVMITKLSQLLRLALQSEGIAEVPLAKELEFATAYLDVEQVRFGDRLNVSINVHSGLRNLLVPNFLLQPLVENAVHHAVAASRGVRSLEITAQRRSGSLVIEVRDDGPGVNPEAMARRRDAIGLRTTRARLEHLYGTAFSFAVQNGPAGGAVAEVIIPLRSAQPAPSPIAQVA